MMSPLLAVTARPLPQGDATSIQLQNSIAVRVLFISDYLWNFYD
jgi:hypothetical protein